MGRGAGDGAPPCPVRSEGGAPWLLGAGTGALTFIAGTPLAPPPVLTDCTPAPLALARTVELADNAETNIVLRSSTAGPSFLTRLLLAANGTGVLGLDGLVVVGVHHGDTYVAGGPRAAGLRGGATTRASAVAWLRWMERYALTNGLWLTPGEDLTVTLRNESGAARRITVTDDRRPAMQIATFGLVAVPPPLVLTATAIVPDNAEGHEIEIPGSTRGGWLAGFGLSATGPDGEAAGVEIGLSSAQRDLVRPLPIPLWQALVAHGHALPEPVQTADGDPLLLVVHNNSGDDVTVSFAGELVAPVWLPAPLPAPRPAPSPWEHLPGGSPRPDEKAPYDPRLDPRARYEPAPDQPEPLPYEPLPGQPPLGQRLGYEPAPDQPSPYKPWPYEQQPAPPVPSKPSPYDRRPSPHEQAPLPYEQVPESRRGY